MRHENGTPRLLLQDGDGRRGRWSRFHWSCARTDGDGALVVSFTGRPIGFPRDAPPRYDVAARLVDDVVVVGVTPAPGLPLRGRAAGRTGLLRVEVPGGARGRTVLDGADGWRRPVFDGDALLQAGGSAGVLWESGQECPATWMQSLAPARAGGHLLLLHTAEERPLPSYAVEVEVRGRRGVVTESREGRQVEDRAVTWHERDGTVLVRSSRGRPGPPAMTAAKLVAFADGLR